MEGSNHERLSARVSCHFETGSRLSTITRLALLVLGDVVCRTGYEVSESNEALIIIELCWQTAVLAASEPH